MHVRLSGQIAVQDAEDGRVEPREFKSQRRNSETEFGGSVDLAAQVNAFNAFVFQEVGGQIDRSRTRGRQDDLVEVDASGAVKDVDNIGDGNVDASDFDPVGRQFAQARRIIFRAGSPLLALTVMSCWPYVIRIKLSAGIGYNSRQQKPEY